MMFQVFLMGLSGLVFFKNSRTDPKKVNNLLLLLLRRTVHMVRVLMVECGVPLQSIDQLERTSQFWATTQCIQKSHNCMQHGRLQHMVSGLDGSRVTNAHWQVNKHCSA